MSDDLERQVDAVFAQKNIACQQCFFYAPKHQAIRCLHPNARQVVRDWEGEHVLYAQPEERNQSMDCPDFKRGTWFDVVLQMEATEVAARIVQAILVMCGFALLWRWITQ